MLRKNSIVKYVFLTIIAIIGILLCVCPFGVPASTDRYNGFIYSIQKGSDISSAVSAEYKCSSAEDLASKIDASIEKIKNTFAIEKFTELNVSRQGEDKLRIEATGAKDTDYSFWYLEDSKPLYMTYDKATESTTPEAIVDFSHIKSVKANYNYDAQAYGIDITFNDEGKAAIKTLKQYADATTDQTIYVYLEEIKESNLLNQYVISDVKEDMFLTAGSSSSYSTASYTSARELSCSILSGSFGYEIELENVATISPKLGKNIGLMLLITISAIIVCSFAFLMIRYKDLGLIALLSLVFFLILDMFLLQAIPILTLNLAGVVAIVLGYFIAMFSNMYIFEKIKEEYAIGKKIYLSCKGGFKKALWGILDSHFMLIIAFIFIWIFAPASMHAFAIIMLVSLLLSLLSSLVLTRYFVHIYLPINSTKANRLSLYRNEGVKELNEEVEIIAADQVENSYIGGNTNE